MKIILSSLIFFFCLTACASNQPEPVTPDYQIIATGQNSGFTLRKTLLIETENELKQFWSIHTKGNNTPLPKIDFTTTVMIAAFYGEQRTGGYSITLDKVEYNKQSTDVYFNIAHPKPGSMRIMVITQPFVILTITKNNTPVRFFYNSKP